MTQSIRISVIVPVHQAEATLRLCVDSLLAQSLPPWEIWLIENGCTDASGAICRAYAQADERVRHVRLDRAGVSHARNAGLQRAAGTHIAFVDADDLLPPNALETLAAAADGAELVMGAYERRGQQTPVGHEIESPKALTALELADYMFARRMELLVGSVWAKLYRTELARQCEFPENISFAEDNVFNMAYANRVRRAVLLPDVVYTYVPQADSLASHILPHMEAVTRVQAFRLAYARLFDVPNGEARVYGCTVNHLLRALNEKAAAGDARAFAAFVGEWKSHPALRQAVQGYDPATVTYRSAGVVMSLLRHGCAGWVYHLLRLKQRVKH